LRYFDLIVPCGISDRRPTSLERILGRSVDRSEVARHLVRHFGDVLDVKMQPAGREEIEARLAVTAA
jgi:lipoate-protein ligase B